MSTVPTPLPMRAMDTIAMPAQSTAVQPEDFQRGLIAGMERALLREPSPPCLLRAPTGSGKTFVISQVLERVSAKQPVLWFWFVPFVTLVQQTADALAANAPSLSPRSLNDGRNQEAHAGMVLLSTAQGVARAQWRTKGYDARVTGGLGSNLARSAQESGQLDLIWEYTGVSLVSYNHIDERMPSAEATYAKVVFLLSQGLRGAELAAWMGRSIAGELTEPRS